jgi:hypothetical protein
MSMRDLLEERTAMPTVSRFDGIRISIYFSDHAPPHFHADYAGSSAVYRIDPPGLLSGSMPVAQDAKILAWASKRQAELQAAWDLAAIDVPPGRIDP